MQVVRSVLFTGLFLGWSGLLAIIALPLLVSRRAAGAGVTFYERSVAFLAKWLIGLDYQVVGRENMPAEPCIYAVAHQSTFEALALHLLLDQPAIVLKRELAQIPVWGWYTRRAGMIPVDREAGAKALKLMVAEAKEALARGQSIAIFPQGTRTPPGVRRSYHSGVAALYGQLKRPIVPVAVNSGVFWGRHSLVKQPGTITLEILPPIPAGLPRRKMMAQLESDLESATDRLVRGVGGTFAETEAAQNSPSGDTE